MRESNNNTRTGKTGELLVASKLLENGWDVYISLCDDKGIDFIIEKEKRILKVQVKTASKIGYNGEHKRYSFGLGKTTNRPDFFICVIPDGFLIVKENQYSGDAFQWYPDSPKKRLQEFYNNWSLLDIWKPQYIVELVEKIKH